MGTAIKHPVPDRVKPSFVIYDIRALWRSGLSVRVPVCQNYKWRLNPVWHRIPYSWTHIYGNSGRQRVNETYHIVSWLCTVLVWVERRNELDKTRQETTYIVIVMQCLQ